MAIQYNKQDNLFQASYQAPFGGLDTSAYASAIAPNNFADMASAYVEDNYLESVVLNFINNQFSDNNNQILGYIPVNVPGQSIIGFVVTIASIYSVTVSLSDPADETSYQLSYAKVAAYAPVKTSDLDATKFSYLVIDQVGGYTGLNTFPNLYWTIFPWSEIWTFNPNTNVASQLTAYIGGGQLGLLDNQMLNLGGYSAADGYVPNRISWSAPGQYGQWQPYSIPLGTGSFAAGFNDLPSTSDILYGCATIGTVAYLFRSQGITQMAPTGNGVQPFTFNHLWASELGVGAIYPASISQYGSICCFVASDGIYSLGLSGLQRLGDQALSRLFKYVNSDIAYGSIIGRMIPNVNDSPDITYILAIPYTQSNLNTAIRLFGIGINSQRVTDFGDQINSGTAATSFNTQLTYIRALKTLKSTEFYPSNQFRLFAFVLTAPANKVGSFYWLGFNRTAQSTFYFRKEQMKFGYVPTVSKIGLLAALKDITAVGNISVSIDGGLTFNAAFPDINIPTGGATNPSLGIIDNVYSDGVQSLERPQLVLKLTNVKIAEAWYQGTLADYELI